MCISNNQPCQARSTIVNINSDDKTIFYPFTISVNKCRGSCNIMRDPYARFFVPNNVKNMNVKVFNLISGVNKTRFIVQHESCECKCGFNKSLFILK